MKTLIAALALAATTGASLADDAWKTQALEAVATYDRVRDASWSESGSLWLFADDADISWETVTLGFICLQLSSAGKPEGEEVLVSWFDHAEALQGNSKRIAQAWCE